MKILIVNTYHYMRGGDCRHVFGLADLLTDQNHEVSFFGMKDDNNFSCPDERYFVSEINYRNAIKQKNPLNALRVIWHSIYSFEARKNISRLLDDIKPDIVHLHSIRHHITKAILGEVAKRDIPVVWTLHDFKEICPNTSFYDGRNICEKCKERKYRNVLLNKCKKGSLTASFVTYLEAKISDWIDCEGNVDLYLAPSNFLRNKFIEYKYNPKKIIHLPNFMDLDAFEPYFNYENYILFLGRLEKGKGLPTLIKGFEKAKKNGCSTNLKIVGSGSEEQELRELVRRLGVENVEFLGFKTGDELEYLTKKAKAIVIPSELYENYPFSGLEAMAYGKPVIGSRIGGIPEQVDDGITGFLFEPFDDKQLANKIEMLNSLPEKKIEEMGRKARQKVEENNDPQIYQEKILHIYKSLIDNRGKSGPECEALIS